MEKSSSLLAVHWNSESIPAPWDILQTTWTVCDCQSGMEQANPADKLNAILEYSTMSMVEGIVYTAYWHKFSNHNTLWHSSSNPVESIDIHRNKKDFTHHNITLLHLYLVDN